MILQLLHADGHPHPRTLRTGFAMNLKSERHARGSCQCNSVMREDSQSRLVGFQRQGIRLDSR